MLSNPQRGNKMLKVLVPTDFSGSGINAAAFAIELFNKKTDELILENVFQTPKEKSGTLISIGDIISNESKTLLEKERRHLKAEYKDINIFIQSEEGSIVHTIKNAMKAKDINLLVLGIAKHATQLSRITSSFVENPQYWPMLTVPQNSYNKKSTELVIIVSEDSSGNRAIELENYLKEVDLEGHKMHHLKFPGKGDIEGLKQHIAVLLKKHKIGLLVFNTGKGDRLQKAVYAHQFDSYLLSFPALLI